jgi:hypothetical protein
MLILMGLACLAGVMDVVLLTAGRSPVKPRVVGTRYELVPVVVRTVAGENPQPGALLTSSFGLEIPSQLMGRRVGVSQVEFFSERGDLLGQAEVSNIRPSDSWLPEGLARPAESSVLIPPLNASVISFSAVPATALRVEPGAKIYAEIDGRAGRNTFSARSALAAAASPGT